MSCESAVQSAASADLFQKISKTLEFMKDALPKNHNNLLARNLRLVDCEVGRVVMEFDVTDELSNNVGILHGGITSAIGDLMTGFACNSSHRLGFYGGGRSLSVALNVHFLSPGQLGSTITVEATTKKVGKHIGVATAEFRQKDDGRLVAFVSQTLKYVVRDTALKSKL